MTNTYRAAKIIKDALGLLEVSADTIAYELAKAGLLAPEPQIIRTREELAALDPDTMLEDTDGSTYVAQEAQKNPSDLDLYADDLPAVVIATGDEYRAAMQALAEADREPPPYVLHRSVGLWQPPPATWEEA